MKLVGREILIKFGINHSDAKSKTTYLINEFEEAEWRVPADIKAVHPSASFLSDNQVVIDVKGNKYRLLIQVNYRNQVIYCKQLGKHSEYNKWKLK